MADAHQLPKAGGNLGERRKLGQGFEVTALSLGAMGYGKSRDIPDRAEMIALLRKAVDLGMDFFDTAETLRSLDE